MMRRSQLTAASEVPIPRLWARRPQLTFCNVLTCCDSEMLSISNSKWPPSHRRILFSSTVPIPGSGRNTQCPPAPTLVYLFWTFGGRASGSMQLVRAACRLWRRSRGQARRSLCLFLQGCLMDRWKGPWSFLRLHEAARSSSRCIEVTKSGQGLQSWLCPIVTSA